VDIVHPPFFVLGLFYAFSITNPPKMGQVVVCILLGMLLATFFRL